MKPACGPDHEDFLYKRAVIVDSAEKKLNSHFTAEAESMAKEAKSLLTS